MRILIVSNGLPPTAFGGVELYSADLARELTRRGHSVLLVCREADGAAPDGTVRRETMDGFAVVRIVNDYKGLANFEQLYHSQPIEAIFKDLLAAFRPDLVHFNHLIALSTGLPAAARQLGIPILLTLHDYWAFCYRINLLTHSGQLCPGLKSAQECYQCVFVAVGQGSRKYRLAKALKGVLPPGMRHWVSRIIHHPGDPALVLRSSAADFSARQRAIGQMLDQFDQVVVPSEFVRSVAISHGIPENRIAVVPLGINLQPQKRKETRDPKIIHIGFAGTLLPTKGPDQLIRAFRGLPAKNLRLDIYGREDIQPLFAQHLHDLAAGDERIVFHGSFRPDQRAEIFAQMDVFVMPSVWHETFSYVAREALRAGVPVITARVGALTEVVQEGVNGFLYPPGDENALSEILRRIAENPHLLDNLCVPGPVEIISPTEHIDRMEWLYQAVLQRQLKEA